MAEAPGIIPPDEERVSAEDELDAAVGYLLEDPFAALDEETEPAPIPYGRSWAFDFERGRFRRAAAPAGWIQAPLGVAEAEALYGTRRNLATPLPPAWSTPTVRELVSLADEPIPTQPHGIPRALHVVGDSANDGVQVSFPAEQGKTYAARAYLYIVSGDCRLGFYRSAAEPYPDHTDYSTTGQWLEITKAVVATETATHNMFPRVSFAGEFYLALLIEEVASGDEAGPFFDGSGYVNDSGTWVPDPSATYVRWEGAPDASASVKGAEIPTGGGSPQSVLDERTLEQWILAALHTAAGAHPIFDDFGIEDPNDMIGLADPSEALADWEERVREALLVHDRIASVENVELEWDPSAGIVHVRRLDINTDEEEAVRLLDVPFRPEV